MNTIRLLSRELFTKVNATNGAHKIDAILQELRDKVFFYNETFCSRFLNEEVRNADFYEDGSAMRHLATVKELFATHIALLWMAIKHTTGALKGKNLGEDETYKLNFLVKSVKSLVSHQNLLEQIIWIISEITDFENPNYSVADLRRILDTFEQDQRPGDDNAKLADLQKLFAVVHKYFMQKAGNYDLPFEIAQEEGDVLFTREVEKV